MRSFCDSVPHAISVGPDEIGADGELDRFGRAHARRLLAEDQRLDGRRAATAEGARPIEPREAAVVEPALPGATEFDVRLAALGFSERRRPPAGRQIRREPGANRGAESRLLRGVAQIQAMTPSATSCSISSAESPSTPPSTVSLSSPSSGPESSKPPALSDRRKPERS